MDILSDKAGDVRRGVFSVNPLLLGEKIVQLAYELLLLPV